MTIRTRIKMCGMTRSEDVAQAIDLGVNALGFIFYSGSKRYLSLAQAKKILREIPPFVTRVAVLVNPAIDLVNQLLLELSVDCLQFHGEECPEFCRQFNVPYIKAIPAVSMEQIEQQTNRYSEASGILIDTPAPGIYGGTGQTFDWSMLPESRTKPLILSGGLNAENVKKAVTSVQPYAVDVCSGIESQPGIKDPMKMKEFVAAVLS